MSDMLYLHIGNNVSVKISDIVGIFDTDTATMSQITKKFLSDAQKNGIVSFAAEDIPKSFIVYKKNGGFGVYLSQLATSTLVGRL